MMDKVSDEEIKLGKDIGPFIDFSKYNTLELVPNAPKEIKKKFDRLLKLQSKRSFNPDFG